MEEHKERIKNWKERDILNVVGKTNAKAAIEEDIKILKSAANATNGKMEAVKMYLVPMEMPKYCDNCGQKLEEGGTE